MNTIEITPHGFGSLTSDELYQIADLLLKAGYTDVGITRKQPRKGAPYVYTLRASRSDAEPFSDNTDKSSQP